MARLQRSAAAAAARNTANANGAVSAGAEREARIAAEAALSAARAAAASKAELVKDLRARVRLTTPLQKRFCNLCFEYGGSSGRNILQYAMA